MNDSVFLVVNNCVLLLSLIDLSNDFQIEESVEKPFLCISAVSSASISWLASAQVAVAVANEGISGNSVYEIGELFELGIQLTYLLLLLALLGVGSFFVIRQVLVRRELDISAKELQVSTFFFFFFWFVLFYNINSFVV